MGGNPRHSPVPSEMSEISSGSSASKRDSCMSPVNGSSRPFRVKSPVHDAAPDKNTLIASLKFDAALKSTLLWIHGLGSADPSQADSLPKTRIKDVVRGTLYEPLLDLMRMSLPDAPPQADSSFENIRNVLVAAGCGMDSETYDY